MTFWLSENPAHSGKTNVWLTPRWILDLFGPFDLDPCGHPGWDTAKSHLYETDNGLAHDWNGFIWCNPPYGVCTFDWVDRFVKHGNGLLLVANRSDTIWWQEIGKSSPCVWFPKGRIKFVDPMNTESKSGPAFSSVIFGMGEESIERLSKGAHLGCLWNKTPHPDPEERKEGE